MTRFPITHECRPTSIQVVRQLGHGRAARAQLVEATFADGSRIACVEKVFAPGLLTRLIYRIGFQSPFAYQTNYDAISASFYRRRVAAAALQLTDVDADVAMPLYVRYDEDASAWVLAAKWIDGRGVKPAPADAGRMRRTVGRIWQWLSGKPQLTNRVVRDRVTPSSSEIDELVALMRDLEDAFSRCGLIGSGWQVCPGALVSTANLLRTKDAPQRETTKRYTIIDLESGIPAVLVPRYVIAGARRGILPLFEDIDAKQLRRWFDESKRLSTFRIGPEATEQLQSDVNRLIQHTQQWKASELALTRRPWRLLTTAGVEAYRHETFRRWRQESVVDDQTAEQLCLRPFFATLLWSLGCVPTSLGKRLQRLVGNQRSRLAAKQFLFDDVARRRRIVVYSQKCQARWHASNRIPFIDSLSTTRLVMHRILESATLPSWHRWIVDADYRRDRRTQMLLALFSARYQAWLGKQSIEASIARWQARQRITPSEAQSLQQSLCGEHVLGYARGFGMHLGLKAIAPVLGPAKIGGVAAFIAGGNLWFALIPFLLTPVLRTLVTLASMWSMRHKHVPHVEALIVGLLPTVGTLAFPMQMFASRPDLSTFLIRDAVGRLGRHLPIYGGPDSRTEIAMIRASDLLLECMAISTALLSRLRRLLPTRSGEEMINGQTHTIFPEAKLVLPATRVGRWLDRLAIRHIQDAQRDHLSQKGLKTDRSRDRIAA